MAQPDPPPTQSAPKSARSLWLAVILAFTLLISAWSLLIFIATKNKPELIEPVQQHTESSPPPAEGP